MRKILALVLVFVSALAVIACKDATPEYKFELEKTAITMTVGGTDLLTVNTDYENPTLSWSSSDPATVEVNDFGGLTAKKSGTATVTVSATLGKKKYSDECTVTVVRKYNETFGETVVYPNDTLDVSLKGGASIENFDYTVMVSKNGMTVKDAVKNNIFSVTEPGVYTLTYSVTGKGLEDSTVTRVITVAEPEPYGFISGFGTTSSVSKYAAASYEIATAPAGNPSGRETALRLEYSASEQHLRFTVPFNLLNVMDANDGGYFELTYYIHHPVVGIPYKHYGYLDIMRQSDDSSNGSIVKRFTGNMFTVNEWATQRLYVSDFKDFIGENVELYVRYHMGNDKVGNDFIDYVYLSEFKYCYGDAVVYAGEDFDAAIPMTKDYDFVVADASGASIATGSAAAPTVSKDDLSVGEYTVAYTVKDNSVSEKTLERKLTVLSADNLNLSADSVMTFYPGANGLRALANAETVTLEEEELPQGAKVGAKALKISGDTEKLNSENGLAASGLKAYVKFMGIRLDKIVADEANLGKYLEFTVRYNAAAGVADGTPINWQYFYIVDGADCFVSFKQLSNFVQLKANQWVSVRIPVLQIKDMVDEIVAEKTGFNAVSALYPGLQIYNRDNTANYSVCFYDAKITDGEDFEEITLGDETVLKNERLNVTLTRSEPNFRYMLKAEKDGVDVTESVIATSGDTKYFAADTAGEYALTYTLAAYGYNAKTVTRKITVSQDAAYFKEFADETLYIGQTLDLSFTETDIDNFHYTVRAFLGEAEVDGIIDSNDVFTPNKAGVYTVEYTVKGDGYIESVVRRTVTVKQTRAIGAIYDFDTVGTVAAWGQSSMTKTTEVPDGMPEGKDSALKLVSKTESANMQHTLVYSWSDKTAYNLMNGIDKLDDNDYYVLRYYLKSSVTNQTRRLVFVDLISDVSKAGGNDANVVRWSNVSLEINKWAELKIRVGDFRTVAEAKNVNSLYLRIHYNKTDTAPVISEVYYYNMTLEFGEKKVAPNTEFSVELFDTQGEISEYEYKIYNRDNAVVKSGDNTSVSVSDGLAAGKYTVVYTHVNASVENNITRVINVTADALPEMNNTDYIQAITRERSTQDVTVDLSWEIVTTDLPQTNLPEGLTEAIKISGNPSVQYPVVFKYTPDIKAIIDNPAYADKSLRFYVCSYQAGATDTTGSRYSAVVLNSGLKDHLGLSAHVGAKPDTAAGAIGFNGKAFNQWHEVKYSIDELKGFCTTDTANYSSLNIGMMIHTATIKTFDVYISALELVD